MTPTFTVSNSVDGVVTVTINYSTDSIIKQYKIDNGLWHDYIEPLELVQNCTVYAKSQDGVGIWSSEAIQVVDDVVPVPVSLSISPDSFDTIAGKTQQITVTANMTDGSALDITFQANYVSNDISIVTVVQGLVTGMGQGTAMISISYGGKTVSISGTVAPPILESISIIPADLSIRIGEERQLFVNGYMSNCTSQDITEQTVWTINNSVIASINSGLVRGLFMGNTTITTTIDDFTASATLKVTRPAVFLKLIVDRCTEEGIIGYNVLRRSAEEIGPRMVMFIKQPQDISPITITNDRLKRSGGKYYTSHGNILSDREIIIKINSQESESYTVEDHKTGIINIPQARENDIVTASYTFDGINVIDFNILQPSVTYYGPVPSGLGLLLPPVNTTIVADNENNRVLVNFEENMNSGGAYYYSFVAIDGHGNQSLPSDEVGEKMLLLHPSQPYKLEYSDSPNGPWDMACYGQQTILTDGPVDTKAPEGPSGIDALVELIQSEGVADVTLTWNPPAQDRFTESKFYRVKIVDNQGNESEPGVTVGPVVVNSGLDKIVIRRKVVLDPANMSFPSFDGSDAETVANLDPTENTYMDSDITDETTYAYSIFAVDKASNHSVPGTVVAEVGDATAPAPTEITDIESELL